MAKSFLPVYDICVVNVNKKRGKKVFEKLGVYDTRGYTKLNIFRFIFWMSQGVRMTGNAVTKLEFLHALRLG